MHTIEPVSKLRPIELINIYFGIRHRRQRYYESAPVWLELKDKVKKQTLQFVKEQYNFDFSLLFYDVTTLCVDHGPMLISNNIFLSKTNVLMNSQGAAFAHNLFSGDIRVIPYDSRLTPYLLPHSTYVAALHDNPSGDVRFINNLFIKEGNARQYDKALLPVSFSGNVYTKGTNKSLPDDYNKRFEELPDSIKLEYPLQSKKETDALIRPYFDAGGDLIIEKNGVYIEVALDKKWIVEQKRKLVTTKLLGKTIIPGLRFENPDGSEICIHRDYFGKNRNMANPFPGPFEIIENGKQRIKVW